MLPQLRGISATNTSNVRRLRQVERIGDTNQFKLTRSGTLRNIRSSFNVAAAIDGEFHEGRYRNSSA
jgi:hypothetical protein